LGVRGPRMLCLVAFCTNEIERFNDGYKNL